MKDLEGKRILYRAPERFEGVREHDVDGYNADGTVITLDGEKYTIGLIHVEAVLPRKEPLPVEQPEAAPEPEAPLTTALSPPRGEGEGRKKRKPKADE